MQYSKEVEEMCICVARVRTMVRLPSRKEGKGTGKED